MTLPKLLTLIIAVLLSSACTVLQEAIAKPGEVLFRDDFSNTKSGWDQSVSSSAERGYFNGSYRILVNEANVDVWATHGLAYRDVGIEAVTLKIAGPDDNDYGLICRANLPQQRFYFFVISSDGYYGIGKVNGSQQVIFGEGKMEPSEEINRGNVTNLIRAECIGDQLRLYINDQLHMQARDDEYRFGQVGVIAGSFDDPGVEVLFDDFMVYKR